jgi:hypothetical protein
VPGLSTEHYRRPLAVVGPDTELTSALVYPTRFG